MSNSLVFTLKFSAIVVAVIDIILVLNLYMLLRIRIPFVELKEIVYYAPPEECEITIEESITLVDSLFGINYNLCIRKTKDCDGRAYIYNNRVIISDKISGYRFIETLAHELCHIKYYSVDETFVEYMTFVELYESRNRWLNNTAQWLAHQQCYLQRDKGTKYDVAFYINKYLEDTIK